MANVNFWADSAAAKLARNNMAKKAVKRVISETKKEVNTALRDYATAIDGAYKQVLSGDRDARNLANAAKGRYKTALQVIVACYPYQTADGILCRKVKQEDGSRIWAEKPLTAVGARGIVRDALKHFADTLMNPQPLEVVIGAPVEK